jgi:hypothetical protein
MPKMMKLAILLNWLLREIRAALLAKRVESGRHRWRNGSLSWDMGR